MCGTFTSLACCNTQLLHDVGLVAAGQLVGAAASWCMGGCNCTVDAFCKMRNTIGYSAQTHWTNPLDGLCASDTAAPGKTAISFFFKRAYAALAAGASHRAARMADAMHCMSNG